MPNILKNDVKTPKKNEDWFEGEVQIYAPQKANEQRNGWEQYGRAFQANEMMRDKKKKGMITKAKKRGGEQRQREPR